MFRLQPLVTATLPGRHRGQRRTRRKATKKYVFEFAVPACRQTGSPWFAVTAVAFQLLFPKHKPALLGYSAVKNSKPQRSKKYFANLFHQVLISRPQGRHLAGDGRK